MKRTSAMGLIAIWATAWVVTAAMAAPAVVTSEGKYVMGDLFDKALETINRVIALRPKNPRLYLQRGEIYVKLQE